MPSLNRRSGSGSAGAFRAGLMSRSGVMTPPSRTSPAVGVVNLHSFAGNRRSVSRTVWRREPWYYCRAMTLSTMPARTLGRTGREVSEIGFGAWQIGADWGQVDEDAAMATLHAAADAGVTFFDTADVYGDGRSERLVGRLLRERAGEPITVATKMGRRVDQTVENYSPEHFRAWNDRSRENLRVHTPDLVQLHCPPTDLYYHPEVFEDLEAMVGEGRIAAYGVSVERVEEGLKAIEEPAVATVQIIFNPFRQRPSGHFFAEAARRGVGIIVRVPLASGLLSGR